MSTDRLIIKNYNTPGHPTFMSGVTKLKQFYPSLTLSRAKSLLSRVNSYSLHRDYKKPARYNPIFVYGKRRLLQIDLADVSSLAEDNRGVKFLLTAIDTFSRKAWVKPLQSKHGNQVLKAFLEVLRDMVKSPDRLLSDRGTEFTNAAFKKMLSEKNIKSMHLYSDQKAAHIERFNRTLKRLMYMYMTQRGNSKYLDQLSNIVNSYNRRIHSSINMSPNEADLSENRTRVLSSVMKNYGKLVTGKTGRQLKNQKKNSLKVNTIVRIFKSRGKFARGFERTFTREKFIIESVDTNKPIVMYNLKDMQGELVEGAFYRNELQVVDS